MKELVAKQVKKTVDGNIGDYIAVPLAEQKEVAQTMAKKIDVELDNSCVTHACGVVELKFDIDIHAGRRGWRTRGCIRMIRTRSSRC